MTPAEVLAAAAEKLDALVGGAAPDWHLSESNHLALPLIEMPYMNGMLKGQPGYTLSGPNDATTFYIAAMNPLVGRALAEWLHEQSSAAAVRNGHSAWALEIARLIIGGESMCPGCGGVISPRYALKGVCGDCYGTTDDPQGPQRGDG